MSNDNGTDFLGGLRRLAWVGPVLLLAVFALFSLSGTSLRGLLVPPSHERPTRPAVSDRGANADRTLRQPSAGGSVAVGRAQPERRGVRPSPVADRFGRNVSLPIGTAWRLIRMLLMLVGLLFAVLLATRILARKTRTMQRIRITPGRTSEASPAQVAGLIEALSRVTRDRWWIRLLFGNPPVAALELVSGPQAGGSHEQRVGIAVPLADGQVEALRGMLSSRYPDVRIAVLPPEESEVLRSWLGAVVRLKKARDFRNPIARPGERSLESDADYPAAPLDAVLSVMAEAGERVLVQITVVPAPNHFQRIARKLAGADRSNERPGTGMRGAIRGREERASADVVAFRPLSFCDIRVGAESYAAARRVAGAIEGVAEGGENQLRQRRPLFRRSLYVGRMVRAESNPLPSISRGVYSSLEIAGLWHLPTPYEKNVAIERSNVPQLPVPPEVLKLPDERLAIATDLNGAYIGIRPGDYRYGVQVSGMAGGGKTSILAKIAECRAREPNTAVIVLDPKGELAEAAVALMPSWRVVRLLDFDRPLFGMALRTPDRNLQAEAAIFSEAMVDVSRTEEGDSQALNASQRSFKMARQATLALEQEPTFWHTARWLASDDDAAQWRARKISELAGDPQWHGVWDHFARILPAQLQKSPAQAVMRLEAPYNKIQTLLGDERLNTVLHHPVNVSFGDVIRRREVLIIAARTPVHPDGDVLLKFFIQLIHRAILAQQPLPEDERAKVAVIGDDAGELFSPTIARMMEHDRSAGLDMALGWQHGGQVSRELAPALDGLCNSRFYLRSAEEDARRAVNRLNPAFDDRLTAGAAELRRKRVEVNQLTSLEKHHAVAVLQAGAALSNSFTVVTIPWKSDPARVEKLEGRMRDEGAYDPEVIAPPRELTGRGENADVDDFGPEEEASESDVPETGESSDTAGRSRAAPESTKTDTDGGPDKGSEKNAGGAGAGSDKPTPDESPKGETTRRQRSKPPGGASRRGKREAEIADLGAPTNKPLSDAYQEVELMRDKASSINWEKRPPSEPAEVRHNALNAEQRSILEALYELRVLTAAQIRREFLMAHSERQARRELALLLEQRMVRRFELGLRGGRGRGKRAYVLDSAGFDVLCQAVDHEAAGSWRAPELRSAQHVVHDLARNEWLFAFRSLAPAQLRGWRGVRSGRVEVPLIKEHRSAPRRLTLRDLREKAPIDFAGEEFANIVPDLTLELELVSPRSGDLVETDLLVEIEWGNNDETVRRKAREYDGFLTGWWQFHDRYKAVGRPPIAFFVVPDLPRAKRFMEILDVELKCHLVGPAETQTRDQQERGVKPMPKQFYLGRRNIFVAVAKDVHQRTLRAWRVPMQPPEARIRAARNAGERRRAGRATPNPFMLVPARDQVDPAA